MYLKKKVGKIVTEASVKKVVGVRCAINLLLTLTLSWAWSGRCEKNYLPKEEGREGGEKKRAQRARRARGSNPGLEPGTCRVLGEGPQLHATGVV